MPNTIPNEPRERDERDATDQALLTLLEEALSSPSVRRQRVG